MTAICLDSCLIRCFKPADVKDVIEVNSSLVKEYPVQFFLGLHYHAPKSFLVAVVDRCIVGYIMCRIERKISRSKYFKRGHIIAIAVMDEYSRRGIGTRLIEASMEAMKSYGVTEIFLETRTINEGVVLFYKKLGFEIKNTMKKYYRDKTDAYHMIKKY